MSSSNLIRWGGLANLLAGLSLILLSIYDLAVPDITVPFRGVIHTIGYLGLSIGLFGLVSLYTIQMGEVGRMGLIGFILAFIGNIMTAGAAFLNAYVVPVASPELFEPTGPLFTGLAGLIILFSAVLVTVGFILFGIATMRAGVLPRWAALLVIISAWFGLAAAFSPIVFHIGGIVFGLGNAWLGAAVWSSARTKMAA